MQCPFIGKWHNVSVCLYGRAFPDKPDCPLVSIDNLECTDLPQKQFSRISAIYASQKKREA